MSYYVQGPNEVLEYEFAWANVIPESSSIVSSVWTATGLTLAGESVIGTTTVAKISGGTLGQKYIVENLVNLSNGETYKTSMFILFEVK